MEFRDDNMKMWLKVIWFCILTSEAQNSPIGDINVDNGIQHQLSTTDRTPFGGHL